MNGPREYKNPVVQIVMVIIGFGILLFIFITFIGQEQARDIMLPFAGILLFFALFALVSQAVKTVISENEISSSTLFGTKTLRWSEITRVSGGGFAIKLHNFDGDVTVAPSPQLPGYEEVIEWIGVKRPDLFSPQEYSELPRNWGGLIPLVVVGFAIIGFGVYVYLDANEFIFPLIFAFIIGLTVLGMAFLAPQSVSIQGSSIVIGYLFTQKTLSADEIAAIALGYTQMRNGKNYHVQITKKYGGKLRISNIKPNLPVAYLVLKNWHKQQH
jgi:hypothetical protein